MTIATHIADVPTLRARARTRREKGPVTARDSADRAGVVRRMLTDSLASELECILRYRRHHFMARGIHSQGVALELLAHSYEKLAHADRIVERIVQLGGVPDLAPDALAARHRAEHVEGDTLVMMIREDLAAERIAIDSYRDMIRYIGEHDPTTRRMLEGILAVEEKHAAELSDLLVAFPEESSAMPRAAILR